MATYLPRKWLTPEGQPVTCEEKVKLLNENLEEISLLCQEMLEDAMLMGCDASFAKEVLKKMIDSLPSPLEKS